ncbi:DUF3883 domain-containing protein [Infirmifilum sp.]|uniref:DUF3883 domain-containing protein n=1 Tax=Infirmifilum sp. TaxID=2856575 RepID=UPI003D131013
MFSVRHGADNIFEEIQREWFDIAVSRVGSTLDNLLGLVSELLFIEPGQFLWEFLQNAEDAGLELGRHGRTFEVTLYGDKVVIEHDSKPFTEEDVRNLCFTISSKKPSRGYKGYIGLGFKSVFKISDHVEVYSGDYSFMFSEKWWRENEDYLRRKGLELRRMEVLWRVVPIPIRREQHIPPGKTRFVIYFKDPREGYEAVAKALDELRPHLFLFLEYVNRVVVEDKVRSIRKSIEWSFEDVGEFDGVKIEKVRVNVAEGKMKDNVVENLKTTVSKFLLFRKEVEVPRDIKEDPVTQRAKRGDVVKREIAVAFALDPRTEDLTPVEEGQFWGVYSFMPLHEASTGLKFLIQGDFIVQPGRRQVNYEAKWNHWLFQEVARLIKHVIKYLAEKYTGSYLAVLDYKEVEDPVYVRLIKPYVVRVLEEELADPEVVCVKGHKVRLSQAMIYGDITAELMREGLLDEDEVLKIHGKHLIPYNDDRIPRRLKDRAKTMSLEDLLNRRLLENKAKSDLGKALEYLRKTYELIRRHNHPLPPEEYRLVITRGGAIKRAKDTYIAKIPDEVSRLMERFPEIREYIDRLDFVHDELARYLGTDYLKQLGVKEVVFTDVCREVLLPRIYVKEGATPPNKEELLLITTICKYYVIPERPVWVLTLGGHVRPSNEVYYPDPRYLPPERFGKLGIEFVDLREYLKQDPVEDKLRAFFELAGVKGLKRCEYYGGYSDPPLAPHPDYKELVAKLLDLINNSGKDENVEYIRMLKQLYEVLKPCWGKQILRVKVLSDQGQLVDSTECLLHDEYAAEEKWTKWRDQGFEVGPFVSPSYNDDPRNVASWRDFFVRVLGVKDKAPSETVERFALWFAEKKLKERGYEVYAREGKGYDLLVKRGDEVVYVEVKGRSREGEVELTEKEVKTAHNYGDRYWLVVVYNIPNDPKAYLVKNPISHLGKISFSAEDIKKRGEQL